MVFFFFSCFGNDTSDPTSVTASTSSTQSSTGASSNLSHDLHWRTCRIYSLKDLKAATKEFDHANVLGKGGFGTVYKGTLSDGRNVAVKKLSPGSQQGKPEFYNEVNLLSTVQHRNLVKLYGCCYEESERLLVYEYLSNKSLDKHLFDPEEGPKLDWDKRHRIILDTAKGLRYLHDESRNPMVHRDIKPGNILLDDHHIPKIADFGLARLFSDEKTHLSTRMAGTLGYLAPEYVFQWKLSKKADVYSFGIVMLEVISGRRNASAGESSSSNKSCQGSLLDFAWSLYEENRLSDLLDPRLATSSTHFSSGSIGSTSRLADDVGRMAHIALLCTQAEAKLRPTMTKVVMLLSSKSMIQQSPSRPAYMLRGFTSEGRKSGSESSTSGIESATPFRYQHRLFGINAFSESFASSSILTPTDTCVSTDHSEVEPR